MKSYRYTARDRQGTLFKGSLEVESEEEVYQKLREKSLYCVSIERLEDRELRASRAKMKSREVAFLCRQLSIMLSAGLVVAKALDILYNRENNRKVKAAYLRLYEDIQKGFSLNEAMQEQGSFFPKLLIRMVQAGERSGTLDEVMLKMADHYEKEYRLIGKMRASMAYPVFLAVITFLVMIALFVFVLPNFFTMFEGADVPGITKAVMAVSNFLIYQWPSVLLAVLVLATLWLLIRDRRPVRLQIDQWKMRLPLFGKQLRTIYVARFTHALSILYSSGIPMIDSIEMGVAVLDNSYVTEKFDQVTVDVGKGEMLSSSIGKTGLFDTMVTSMIFIGEESGSLDQMLDKLSSFYDNESELAIQKITALLEPIMLVIIALMVGVIVAAVMLPIYNMYLSVL